MDYQKEYEQLLKKYKILEQYISYNRASGQLKNIGGQYWQCFRDKDKARDNMSQDDFANFLCNAMESEMLLNHAEESYRTKVKYNGKLKRISELTNNEIQKVLIELLDVISVTYANKNIDMLAAVLASYSDD